MDGISGFNPTGILTAYCGYKRNISNKIICIFLIMFFLPAGVFAFQDNITAYRDAYVIEAGTFKENATVYINVTDGHTNGSSLNQYNVTVSDMSNSSNNITVTVFDNNNDTFYLGNFTIGTGTTNDTSNYLHLPDEGTANITADLDNNDPGTKNITADYSPPGINLTSPGNNHYSKTPDITFQFNATDSISVTLNCSLFINDSLNQTNDSTIAGIITSFNITGISDGIYNWSINCTDDALNKVKSPERTLTIAVNTPNATGFNVSYGTTNFSDVNITNVTNMTLANEHGKIQFPADYGINASGEDYNTHVKIGDGFISVNTSGLDQTFNSTANLTLNNVTCPATIYFASGTFASKEGIIAGVNVCNATTDPNCTIINCSGGRVTFTVSHFTGFASAGTANLTIRDETDSMTKYPCEQVKFFANYTNSTDAIQEANCTIWFNDTGWKNMTWKASGFYEYNRSFTIAGTYNWNVTCNKTGYSPLTANDSITISINNPPDLTFIEAPANGTYTNKNFTGTINISIIESNPYTFMFNWNGTNYTFYDDSLVLAMNFNNNSELGENSTLAYDFSKYGNNGTIFGATYRPGKFDKGLKFDGVNDYVECSVNKPGLVILKAITIEAWVNETGRKVNGTLISRKNGTAHYIFGLNNGTPYASIGDGTNFDVTDQTFEMPANEWHHMVFVLDSDAKEGYIYYDGNLMETSDLNYYIGNLTGINATIGAGNKTSNFFNGTIDEVRIYNRALSAAEIEMHYYGSLEKYNSTQWYFRANIADSDGTYTYYAWANDTAGSENWTRNGSVLYDYTNPRYITLDTTKPTAGAGGPYSGVEGSPIIFNASNSNDTNGISLYEWDWNNNGTYDENDSLPNASHTWDDNGTYTVALRVTDIVGNTNTTNVTVTVNDTGPTAEAGANQTINEGQTINVNGSNSTTGPDTIVLYEWDWTGDGIYDYNSTNATATSPSYNDNRTYTVTLRVTDDDGSTDTDNLTVTVDDLGPTAEAGANQTINEGQTIGVNGSNSTTGPDAIVLYEWDWTGDGIYDYNSTNATATSPTYNENGTYTITLRVTDDDGSNDTDTLTVTVNDTSPIANASIDQTVNEGDLVTFNGSNSTPGSSTDNITLYKWNFGDGSPSVNGSNLTTPNHTYIDDGIYTVTLTVYDNDSSASDTLNVTVINLPPNITLIKPQGSKEYSKLCEVFWNVTDPGNDTFTVTIQYKKPGSDWKNITSVDVGIGSWYYSWDISGEIGNNYQINVIADDNDGDKDEDISGNFTIDNTLLQFIDTVDVTENPFSPNNDGIKDTTTIIARFSKNASWTIYINNTSVSNGTGLDVSYTWNGSLNGSAVSGEQIVKIIAKDITNPQSTVESTTTVTIDVSAPDFNITMPVNNTWYGTEPFILSTDNLNDTIEIGSPCFVTYTANNNINITLSSLTYFSNKCSGVVSIPGSAAEGAGTLNVFVTDASGNTGKATQTTGFDKTPPVISFEQIGLTNNNSIEIKFNATDNSSGVDNNTIKLKINGILHGCIITKINNIYICLNSTPSLEEGMNLVQMEVKDNVSNSVEEMYLFTLDTSSPFASCTLSRTFTKNGSNIPINISCIAADPSLIDSVDAILKMNGVRENTTILKDDGTGCDTKADDTKYCGSWTPSDTTWDADGTITIDINVSDGAGNVNVIDNALQITIDSTPPIISNQSPGGTKNITGVLELSAIVTDATTDVEQVTFSLMNGVNAAALCYGMKNGDNYSCSIDTHILADDNYNVTVTAWDTVNNNISKNISGSINTDNNAPEIDNIIPFADEKTDDKTPEFTVNVSEGTGLGAVVCNFTPYINGNPQANFQENVVGLSYCSWTQPTDLNEGDTIYVSVKVKDVMEHWSDIKDSGKYIINDSTPPEIIITSPLAVLNKSGILTISANVTDNVEVKKVEFRLINNSNIFAICSGTKSTGDSYSCNMDTNTVPDGKDYKINVIAEDTSGNPNSTNGTGINIDNNAPEIKSITPSVDKKTNDTTPEFTVNVSDGTGLGATKCEFTVYINGTYNAIVNRDVVGGKSCSWNSSSLSEGATIYVSVRVNDTMGFQSNTRISGKYIINDLTPPVINITNPSVPVNVSEVLMLSANVTDNINVKKVEFRLIRGSTIVAICTGTKSTGDIYNCSIDTRTVQDGDYTLNVIAEDTSGNLNSTNGTGINIDNNAPQIDSISPPVDKKTDDTTPTFTVNVSDGTGLGAVVCNFTPYINGTFQQTQNVTVINNSCSWTPTNLNLNEGDTIYVSVNVKDAIGHWSDTEVSGKYIINDLTPPTINNISSNSPSGPVNVSKVLMLSANVTDNINVKKVEFRLIRGSTIVAICTGTKSTGDIYNCSIDTRTVQDGNYTLNVIAWDNSDNSNNVDGADLKIDNTAPEIGITPGTETPTKNETPVFNVTVDDGNGVGAANCTFTPYVNGTKQTSKIKTINVTNDSCLWNYPDNLTDGSRIYVIVRVTDKNGNWNEKTSGEYKIYTRSPFVGDVVVEYPAGKNWIKNNDTLRVRARVIDNSNGIKNNSVKATINYLFYTYDHSNVTYGPITKNSAGKPLNASSNCTRINGATGNTTCTENIIITKKFVIDHSNTSCTPAGKCQVTNMVCNDGSYNINDSLTCKVTLNLTNVANDTTYNISGTVDVWNITYNKTNKTITLKDTGAGSVCDLVSHDNNYCEEFKNIHICNNTIEGGNYCGMGETVEKWNEIFNETNVSKQVVWVNVSAEDILGNTASDGTNFKIDNRGYHITVYVTGEKIKADTRKGAKRDDWDQWIYKFQITIKNRPDVNKIRIRLDDWVSWQGSIRYVIPIENMGAWMEYDTNENCINKNDEGYCIYDLNNGTYYNESQPIYALKDEDNNKTNGIQDTITLVVPVPEGTHQGVYSTKYYIGLYNNEIETEYY